MGRKQDFEDFVVVLS